MVMAVGGSESKSRVHRQLASEGESPLSSALSQRGHPSGACGPPALSSRAVPIKDPAIPVSAWGYFSSIRIPSICVKYGESKPSRFIPN